MELKSNVDYTEDEWQAIWVAMWNHWQKIKAGKTWLKHVNIEAVYRALRAGNPKSVLSGGYLVAYDVYSPWWNPERRTLSETVVIGVAPTAPFSHVPKVLESLARRYNCRCLTAGDALTIDPRVGRTYERAGWRDEASQYFKEL